MADIENYRSGFRDALSNPIPLEGELRVWLDDDLEDRPAPGGWVHMRTVREVCLQLLTGRVIELSLDNDLDGDVAFGQGYQVIDFLEEMHGVHHRPLWPRDGLTIHTANSAGKARMVSAVESLPRNLRIEIERSQTPGGKSVFHFTVPEDGS